MGKKKKRTLQVAEKPTGAAGGVSGQWILNIANKMEPEGTLKNDGRLTEMKSFKKQWKTYTGYLKECECLSISKYI